jgi:hypothetical protein
MGVVEQNGMAVLMMLATTFLALSVSCTFFLGIFSRRRNRALAQLAASSVTVPSQTIFPQRPTCWLAIRGASPESVQAALGLDRSMPCTWSEGMTGEHTFFISPRVNGWVIVTGVAIPTPDDDVDECFHFLISLSRKLGHVQFFYAEKSVFHHAWARLDEGCVTRAYAWTGDVVWSQGPKTIPEIGLGMKCFGYGERCPLPTAARNAQKVSQLAARWNFDPAAVDERTLSQAIGVAVELPKI